jgi:NAD(P)-dependent dehydrogenase (short-subunit alcohol dehydrogenase family)
MEDEIQSLFKQTGEIDHIVFTAADALANVTIPLASSTYETILAAGQIRFFAPLLVAKIGIHYLNPGPESSITVTTGGAGEKPVPGWSVIASYFSGLHGMVRNLALDLKPVRVNLVSAGMVDTGLWEHMGEGEREGMFRGYAEMVPTGHVGRGKWKENPWS